MKLVIGLGNPEKKYNNTRHNTGFLAADQLLKLKLPKSVVVKKSDVFMNKSGDFVSKLISRYSLPIDHLYIIHDDLDIPLGSYKIQFAKGPRDHNGLKSINDRLGSGAYWHVRVGVNSTGLTK